MAVSGKSLNRFTLLAPDSPLYMYLLRHQPPEHETMSALRAVTRAMANGFMQIGVDQAHMMAFLVRLTGARRILELGTFTGYSTLAMALALPADGKLITCDIDDRWAAVGQTFWQRAGVAEKIELKIGPAIKTLDDLKRDGAEESFDVVFVDADKEGYDQY